MAEAAHTAELAAELEKKKRKAEVELEAQIAELEMKKRKSEAELAILTAPRVRADLTGAFMNNLVCNIPTGPIAEDDLRKMLSAPIPGEILVEPGYFRLSTAKDILPLVELRPDAKENTMELSLQICKGSRRSPLQGAEEVMASNAGFVTAEIWQSLYMYIPGFNLRSSRNVVDTSGATLERLRPDYLLWVDGALFLKGEHKRTAADLCKAKMELLSKMNVWGSIVCRDLPFIPCYALAGASIQFCAIFPPTGQSPTPLLKDISDILDLGNDETRLTVMRISLNMFRVFAFLKAKMTPGPGLFVREPRGDDGGYIEFRADYVLKKCYPCIDNGVYSCLQGDNALPCAVKVICTPKIFDNGMRLLEIRPVCEEKKPRSIAELRCAIRSVLTALAELHSRGFVHRDVRWPNVLKDGSTWRLADFELAGRVGAVVPPAKIATIYLPPELQADGNAGYEPSGDVYCVGVLVRELKGTSGLEYSDEMATWVSRVTCVDPSNRPSANSLLTEASGWLHE
uniref:non-specific serine/threonine protein kinase n=1 Tax=Cryptomonas curvata TaxID=233186 RepID=A0A7S0MP89_9CRYP